MTRRYHPQVIKDRSPLHASALRLKDVHPGVEYIKFNRYYGIMERGVFLSTPFVTEPAPHMGHKLMVRVSGRSRGSRKGFLGDMGITPYSPGRWNEANFTIRASKEHLLPAPLGHENNPITAFDGPLDFEDMYGIF